MNAPIIIIFLLNRLQRSIAMVRYLKQFLYTATVLSDLEILHTYWALAKNLTCRVLRPYTLSLPFSTP